MLYPLRQSEQQVNIEPPITPADSAITERIRIIDTKFAQRLGDLDRIRIEPYSLFGAEYFIDDPKGRDELQEICSEVGTSVKIPDEARTREDQRVALFATLRGIDFNKISEAKRNKLIAHCRDYANARLYEALTPALEDPNVNSDGIAIPFRYETILNPDQAIHKLDSLRVLKAEIKKQLHSSAPIRTPQEIAIYQLYLQKINAMIAGLIPDIMLISDNQPEQTISGSLRYSRLFLTKYSREKALARIDRFRYGAGEAILPSGDRTPIGIRARNAVIRLLNHPDKEDANQSTVTNENYGDNFDVKADLLTTMFEKVLEENGLSKGQNSNGWEVITTDKKNNLSVDSKRRTIYVPANFNRRFLSIQPASVLAVVGHEIAHVFQAEIRESLGIELLEQVNAPRSEISSEGGGVREETRIQQELFRLPRETNTYYLAAISMRLRGGNFVDCILESFRAICRQHPNSDRQANLHLAIDRTQRIFRNHGDLESRQGQTSNSEPLAYLEQSFVPHIDRFGAIPYSLKRLVETGVIDLGKIRDLEDRFRTADTILTPDVIRELQAQIS